MQVGQYHTIYSTTIVDAEEQEHEHHLQALYHA